MLARDATHLGALTNLGAMFFGSGRRIEARVLYEHAVRHHPADELARTNLAIARGEA